MPSFKAEIRMGNAAMQTGDDVADALLAIAGKVREGYEDGPIRDENGNTVGRFTLELPEPEGDE